MELTQLLNYFGTEVIAIVTIIIVYALFVKPKDKQINDLVDNNKQMVNDNSSRWVKYLPRWRRLQDS